MDQEDQPAAPPGLWVTPAGSLMVFHFEISEEPTASENDHGKNPDSGLKQSRRKGKTSFKTATRGVHHLGVPSSDSWHFSPGLRAAPSPSTWHPGCTATRVAGRQDQSRSHPFRPAHLMTQETRHAWDLFSRDPGFRSPAGSYWRGVYCDPSPRSVELHSSSPSVGNVC